MSMACSIADARNFALAHHGDQLCKNGEPYVQHLDQTAYGVWELVGLDSELIQAAYLHDVVEDTDVTGEDLLAFGFSERTVGVVAAVTKPKQQQSRRFVSNPEYIGTVIKFGPDAMVVKLADLYSNTDPSRLALLPEATQVRLRGKYLPAIWRLEQELVALKYLDPYWCQVSYAQAKAAAQEEFARKSWHKVTAGSKLFPGDSVRWGDGAEFKFEGKDPETGLLWLVNSSGAAVNWSVERLVELRAEYGFGANYRTPWQSYLGEAVGGSGAA